jgi:acyl-ACP thioesterase
MNPVYWEEAYLLRSYEVDFRNRLRLTVLFQWMQETATNQIERQGVGIDVLRSRNEAWVLSRLLLQMDRYPGRGEEIRVKTWPRGIERLFAHRDFQISKADGEILGRATSYWLLVDLATRRPKRLEVVFKHMPTAPEQQAVRRRPEKLPRLEKPEEGLKVLSGYSHLDLNNHVNNAHYIEWILDAFSAQVHETFQVSRLQVNFQAETKIGDRITLYKEKFSENQPGPSGIEGRKNDGKTLAFQARLDWREDPVIS